MRYKYSIRQTEGTVGFAACEPEGDAPLELLLEQFEKTPNDSFLRRHLLDQLENTPDPTPFSKLAVRPALDSLLARFWSAAAPAGVENDGARELRAAFRANLLRLQKIPPSLLEFLPSLPNYGEIAAARDKMRQNAHILEALWKERAREEGEPPDSAAFLERVLQALERAGLPAGGEMRHEQSLSPVGLLREWHLVARTVDGPQESELRGIATAYGRGLGVAAARISLAMEIVERASAHVDIQDTGEVLEVAGRLEPFFLTRASIADLEKRGASRALTVSAIPKNARLSWARGEDRRGTPVFVPAQAVFLFCNLDEPDFFEDIGSTGLAAGASKAQARLAALLEIVERDAAATTPFYTAACFRLRARDRRLQGLLDDYAAKGIDVRFQDITTETGAPAYRCHVLDRKGNVHQASAAALDSKKAIISALTETPWNYAYGRPVGEAGMPPLGRLPQIWLEDLPDFSLGAPEKDLALLEDALEAQGIVPAYVDLTRADLGLPVCRAIAPGLEARADAAAGELCPRTLARLQILAEQGLLG